MSLTKHVRLKFGRNINEGVYLKTLTYIWGTIWNKIKFGIQLETMNKVWSTNVLFTLLKSILILT